MAGGHPRAASEGLQVVLAIGIPLAVPFSVYAILDNLGLDITGPAYLAVVGALLATALSIWAEGFASLSREEAPAAPQQYPPATAIIAAALANEAETIGATIEAFLAIDYPGGLEVILSYSAPEPVAVEDELRELEQREPRFMLHRLEGRGSKAEAVNSAANVASGEFVGIFDADHQPAPDSFSLAWRWLSAGYDVVQGHCVVRNGCDAWVSRLVAVEFEVIYAVSHPGRARVQGYGLFGGSNGYWKAEVLQELCMRGTALTEDIDSAIRGVLSGHEIRVEPSIVSRELAPTRLGVLWNQRLRWAQGWTQVSRRHLVRALRSRVPLREKLGLLWLLGWREAYPWVSMQMLPILAYWISRDGLAGLDWAIPVFLVTTAVTLSVGPGQAAIAYRNAVSDHRDHPAWFWFYGVVSVFFYNEFRDLVSRVAQIKESASERQWRVTPRQGREP